MHTKLNEISIRRAGESERAALLLLSVLDGGEPLSGEILVAYVDNEPQAAMDVHSGATITDPFRATDHLVELLGLRAAALRGQHVRARRPWLRRLREARAAEA